MSNEATDFLFGSASPSAKFTTVGAKVSGTIVEPPVITDQRDLEGGVRTFDNGDARKQLVITLQTDERDASIDDDKGIRKLYVKGSKDPASKSLTAAIALAVKAANANGLEVGGKLTVQYIGDGPQEKRGYNRPKQYSASYEAPSVSATAQFLNETPPTAELPQAPATVAATAPGKTPAETAKELLAAGLEPHEVSAATGLTLAVVAALKNTL